MAESRREPKTASKPSKSPGQLRAPEQPPQTFLSGLYVAATPIGNLKDITLRALEALKAADLVVCEDTRVTGNLLAHYGIKKALVAYHDHNASQTRPRILKALGAGQVVVLVSDAGTPLISDPGFKLVREAAGAGHSVVPLPGPNAALSALSASALPTDKFFFAGFPPMATGARKAFFTELASIRATLVFYESARRLPAVLREMAAAFGSREAVVARELTKLYEEIRRAPLAELAVHYAEAGAPKGEVVILIGPPAQSETLSDSVLDGRIAVALKGNSLRAAVDAVTAETGVSRRRVYTRALELKKGVR